MLSKAARCGVLLILAAGAAASAQQPAQYEPPVRFDGHKVVRVTVHNLREYRTVLALTDDVLTCEGSGIGTFDVRMAPDHYAAFIGTGITHTVQLDNYQAHLDQIRADDAAIRAHDDDAWFATYRTLAEMESRMSTLAATYPTLATYSNIGTSIQGRQIRQIRITGPGDTTNRPAFIINANQHAREWVAPMGAMYIVDRFLETYATDSRIRNIVDHIDFYIVPCANPDGYEYSRLTNPGWRKNRHVNTGTNCTNTFGVDLNRNWGYKFAYDNTGSSGTCSSDTYRGTGAFSEPESTALKGVSDALHAQGRLKVHWDIHTNGQAILSCWGYTTSPPPPDLPLFDTLGQMIQTGMASVRGTDYPYGQGSVILYLANGVTRDYSYAVNGALSWSIELGGASFQPAVSEILPISKECLQGLLPLAEYFIPPCYANCDASTSAPILNVADFTCFLQKYAGNDPYANCDASTSAPTLNVADFTCFLQKYATGCT